MHRHRHANACLGTVVALLLTLAGPAFAAGMDIPAEARIRFSGTSTLHDFEGTVDARPFVVRLEEEAGARRVSALVRVAVAGMDTQNAKRDTKMKNMLKHRDFSFIQGRVEQAPVPENGSGDVDLYLSICGNERLVPATVSDWLLEDGKLAFNLAFRVSLESFQLKPPSVLGLIRVGDAVRIECTVAEALDATPAD